ncbi:hypothetical protein D554_3397 [Bordetella holmesii 30539]|uniref:N-acetyltransferase YedL n=1 Tax=Bordetella holmesii 1058 TaxID=1247648 RepID=A0ABN0RY38_9BORD|nr:hypothetical protein D560_3503 [Bordetella holmesii ATCC 51541]AIT28113.1 hypothetical protein D558_3473 [Bordetella holmesii 44057]EWM42836.1 hypothetical protein D556_3470 [Bordetella holmesii 41130]EWM44788.1 hypothetical protein D557_2777 [Bordetella holmesii 70147]EXF88120.1 hypothetical protein D554_3397 [Bordetella holmesii 30539]EXX94121.1 hypothetical protein D559_1530 [Bordetella holmesii 1058]
MNKLCDKPANNAKIYASFAALTGTKLCRNQAKRQSKSGALL